ncbi:MAG: DNA gyrase/topoisomerase IV subunit A, partial [Muribaculaceae bacterium]
EGRRGGAVKIRAKIEKVDNRTLAVTEIPYGKTTGIIIDSILKAYEKDKIKIRKVDDNTAEKACILVHLQPGTSSDKAIDALYAFTDCEVSVSPNCCVIDDRKPCFLGVDDLLRHSVDSTRGILEAELRVRLAELQEQRLFASLEKIFIEERIYKDKEYEQAPDIESAVRHIDSRLEKYKPSFVREINDDDILKLVEIKMKRIFKFSSDEADDRIAELDRKIADVNDKLAHIVDYTIEWYKRLKAKYGDAYPRRTVIRNFDNIEAANVAEANERLYINREDGFIGTGLKKDEFICNCSSLDDIIIFYKDGRYKVVKVQDKLSVGKNVLYVNVFKRNDSRTIYNVIYRNGAGGIYYMKRFAVTGVTRDKEYNLTQGQPGSKVMWFSANPNGEAEVVKVTLKPKHRLKTLQFDVDFAKLAIKGKQSQGNLVTKNEVHRFSLKEHGASTLGGREVWFDPDVLRLNYDGRGRLLGEFMGDDLVLVVLKNGEYYTTGFEATNHYDDNILRIEKFRPKQVWTAILFDADQGYPYIKRFMFEPSARKQRFIGDNERSSLILLTDTPHARFEVRFAAPDDFREPLIVDAENFIGLKSFKAKGKRLVTYTLDTVTEIEPLIVDSDDDDDAATSDIIADGDETADGGASAHESEDISDDELRDEITGQKRIF